MIIMPPNVKNAVWLTKLSNGRNLHYVLAYNDEFMFKILESTDGIRIGNVIEADGTFLSFFNNIINMVKEEGYVETDNKWDSDEDAWYHQAQRGSIRPMLETSEISYGGISRLFETVLQRIDLKATTHDDLICLELRKTTAGEYRLDHYAKHHSGAESGFPCWQTLFTKDQRTMAENSMQRIVLQKLNEGYKAHHFEPAPEPTGVAAKYPLSAKVAKAFKGVEATWF